MLALAVCPSPLPCYCIGNQVYMAYGIYSSMYMAYVCSMYTVDGTDIKRTFYFLARLLKTLANLNENLREYI